MTIGLSETSARSLRARGRFFNPFFDMPPDYKDKNSADQQVQLPPRVAVHPLHEPHHDAGDARGFKQFWKNLSFHGLYFPDTDFNLLRNSSSSRRYSNANSPSM